LGPPETFSGVWKPFAGCVGGNDLIGCSSRQGKKKLSHRKKFLSIWKPPGKIARGLVVTPRAHVNAAHPHHVFRNTAATNAPPREFPLFVHAQTAEDGQAIAPTKKFRPLGWKIAPTLPAAEGLFAGPHCCYDAGNLVKTSSTAGGHAMGPVFTAVWEGLPSNLHALTAN